MSEHDGKPLAPLYTSLDPDRGVITIFLPKTHDVDDIKRWYDETVSLLQSKGYKAQNSNVISSSQSKGPCKELWAFFTQVESDAPRISDEHLLQVLKPKYEIGAVARYIHGHGFDDVRVGSHIQISAVVGAHRSLRLSDKDREWLDKWKIEFHSGSTNSGCFNFILPAGLDPEAWQFTLANTLGAFLLSDSTHWSS